MGGRARFRPAVLIAVPTGILLIIVSWTHFVASRVARAIQHPVVLPYEEATKTSEIDWDVTSSPVASGHGVELVQHHVDVQMTLVYPRFGFADDSFFVRVSDLTFSYAGTDPSDVLLFKNRKLLLERHTNRGERTSIYSMIERFPLGGLGISLSIPGAEVSPTGVVQLTEGDLKWAVRPTHSGTYKGLFHLSEIPGSKPLVATWWKPEYWFEFVNSDSSFSIEVKDRILTRERLISWMGTFFGAFLTLPGIIAFLNSRREREKKRQEEEGKTRRIIVS